MMVLVLVSDKALATTPPDPCQSASVAKRSVVVFIPQATTGNTELIPASSQSIHVCGFAIDGASFAFVYGSGVARSVSSVPLTAPFSSDSHVYSGPGSVFSVPANDALCVNSAGLTVRGVLTYTRPYTDPVSGSLAVMGFSELGLELVSSRGCCLDEGFFAAEPRQRSGGACWALSLRRVSGPLLTTYPMAILTPRWDGRREF